MEENSSKLSPNSIAFIGLAHEYCTNIENAREAEREEFIDSILKLLPRLYISASDIKVESEPDIYIEQRLDEDYYDSVRRNIEILMGPDDTYLEVFESDMKYSDTPIADSIAEGLADIYQDLYNFITTVKDAPQDVINDIIAVCKENFETYWSQKLCNVLRAVNNLKYHHDV